MTRYKVEIGQEVQRRRYIRSIAASSLNMLPVLLQLLCFFASTAAKLISADPTAKVKNGTLVGRYLGGEWDQDLFLGIPYAQPPLGQLRFAWPQSTNASYDGTLTATQYGYSCYQYNTNFNLSEDCLTLNVVRPHETGQGQRKLPVLIWIYGGGLSGGSTADPQYNLSGIVRTASEAGTPIIAASINYRLGVWGFLQTPQILAEGSSNAGLLDQRLAMRWLKENVAGFGGNPEQITIWGESAGAQSIGLHLHSYGGRNDDLYQAAILESGGPVGTALETLSYYVSPVENLTRTLGCHTSSNQLQCLRELSSEQLYAGQVTQVWNPLVDGDFLTAYPSTLMANGSFVRVPLLIGANSDEGTSFGTKGLDNSTAILNDLLGYRSYAISPPTARMLLDLYPNDPSHEPPYDLMNDTIFPQYGLQWRREAAIAGDIVMIGQRRKVCQEYTSKGLDVYSYRFAQRPWNATEPAGVGHFVNVVFSFQNISGALGPLPQYQDLLDLSHDIGKAYANFASYHDPNGKSKFIVGQGNHSLIPAWPKWTVQDPVNMVLLANGSWVEPDTFREQGIAFINSVDREFLA